MIIAQKFLDDLSAHAKANPRLRQSYDLRTTPDDKSQRMLNALEPGTIMPIHRHRNTSEKMVMVMVRGKLIERFYGCCTTNFGYLQGYGWVKDFIQKQIKSKR